MKKALLSIVATAAMTFATLGQAPQSFKYQAVVRDALNTILTNQAVGFQLTIQEGSIGGTAVYTETFTPTSNSYGIINIEIGTGTTVDDFSAIDWANNSYFLETSIDVSGGSSYVVMGTSQFMSVPYALHAKTADNAITDNVDDADNDPTNEIETWGTLGGIPADLQDGDDNTQLNETEVDAFVANNGYITSPDDADADPTNELQSWSNLPGIPADFSDGTDDVDDADSDPTNELQDWSSLPGIPADFSDDVDNVDDADNDPTNEIETWGTLGGIPTDLQDGDDNTQLNEAEVDAFVANNGYITSPDDADADPTNELQNWSNLPGIPADFTDNVDNVDDADADPANELQNWSNLPGIPADFSDGTDDVDDADADPINEIQDLQLLGNILTITNNGTATSIDLSAYLDNTDTQLNEAQVDAFVANNGYITSPDDADNDPTNELQNWSNLPGIPADFSDGTDDVDDADNDPTNEIETWGTLAGIPADLQDGDDNTQLNETEVDAFVANNGYITSPDDADADPTNEIQDLSLSGNTLSLTNDATTVDLSAYQSNTLDDAYDQGGAGAGRIITADAGTVEINGTGGLLVDANTTTLSIAAQINNSDGTNSTETYIGRVGLLSNNVFVEGVRGEAKLASAINVYDGGFGVLGLVKHPTNGTVNLNASATSAGNSVNKAVGVGGTIGTASDYIGGPQDMIAAVWGGTGLHNSGNGSVSGGAKLYAGLFQGNGRTLGLWGENSTYMEFMPRWQVRDYDAGVIGFYNSDPDGGNNDADAGTGDDYLSIEANVTDATVKHVVLQTRTNGNVGIGTPSPTAKLDVEGTARVRSIPSGTSSDNYIVADASGNIKTAPIVVNVTDGGANLRMYTGHTPSTGTGWFQYDTEGIYIDVNISACGFTTAPQIYTTLEGSAGLWQSKGVTSIYSKTATGFRVYVNLTGITIAVANSWNWHVSWFAIGN